MRQSLFEPSGGNALGDSAGWIADTMLGSVATGLCVLAVAFVGVMMLTGRLDWRQGVRVIAGCFVVFGAPVIAAGLMGLTAQSGSQLALPSTPAQTELGPREELPPAEYDPYAGASLRRD